MELMNNKDWIFFKHCSFCIQHVLTRLPRSVTLSLTFYECQELNPCAPTSFGAYTMEKLTKEGGKERKTSRFYGVKKDEEKLIWEKLVKVAYYESLGLYPELIITWLNSYLAK